MKVAGAGRTLLEVLGIAYVGSMSSKIPRAAFMLMFAPAAGSLLKAGVNMTGLHSENQVSNSQLYIAKETLHLGTFPHGQEEQRSTDMKGEHRLTSALNAGLCFARYRMPCNVIWHPSRTGGSVGLTALQAVLQTVGHGR